MIKLVVGSQNPVKIAAAKVALEATLKKTVVAQGVDAPSHVADQPFGDDETRLGALNRVAYCQAHHSADYYAAMEGGAAMTQDGPVTFAYVVIANHTTQSVGRSAQLPLPQRFYDTLLAGDELGNVMDAAFNTHNVKQQGGAIGLLTNHATTRGNTYTQALILAMAKLLHSDLY